MVTSAPGTQLLCHWGEWVSAIFMAVSYGYREGHVQEEIIQADKQTWAPASALRSR